MKQEVVITQACYVRSAPNFTCLIRLLIWRDLHDHIQSEVGDSSHMTWLESDSSHNFQDLRLAWLKYENDLTLTWEQVTWDLTWLEVEDSTMTWTYNKQTAIKLLFFKIIIVTSAPIISVCAFNAAQFKPRQTWQSHSQTVAELHK